jgi:hypothetical protein
MGGFWAGLQQVFVCKELVSKPFAFHEPTNAP